MTINKPESLKLADSREELLKIANKLMPQEEAAKVKGQLEDIAELYKEIESDGLELEIDERINEAGNAGEISIYLTSSLWPELKVIFYENFFDNKPESAQGYDAAEIKELYKAARSKAYSIVGKKALSLLGTGELVFSNAEGKNNNVEEKIAA